MLSRVEQVKQFCTDISSISHSDARPQVDLELTRILQSEQFRTSHRGSTFLQHVMAKAMEGEFDALKERILGIELFARDSTFDTEHDSVVRVAANDVRRRLKDYYREHSASSVRIDLPSGVYIPRIEVLSAPAPPEVEHAGRQPATAQPPKSMSGMGPRLAMALLLAAIGLLLVNLWTISPSKRWAPGASRLAPWSALLKTGRQIRIVVADANLVLGKVRSGSDVPISAYASRSLPYVTDLPGAFGDYINAIPLTTVSDAMIASRISQLATAAGSGAQVLYCNRLTMSDLKGDDPVVLLGSPTSNPWVALLNGQLNFQLVRQFDRGREICLNRHPQAGEPAEYSPSRRRVGVSEGYAIVSLAPNLTGKAPVLVIAGTSTEATEAAGDFVTNLDALSAWLRTHGLDGTNCRRLELVIKTSYVSGASADSEVVAYRTQE